MKILMLNYEFPPLGGGGGQAHLALLQQYAGRRDLEVDVLTSMPGPRVSLERLAANILICKVGVHKKSLHVWRRGEIVEWLLKAKPCYRRMIRQEKYDLVHAFFGFPTGWLCYRTARRLPYIISLRGSDVPGANARLTLDYKILGPLVFRPIWKNAAALVACSEGLKARALQFLPTTQIEIIPNGVDLERFYPMEEASNGRVGLAPPRPAQGTESVGQAPPYTPQMVCEKPVQRGMDFQPMNHRPDADATTSHGQDAHATSHARSQAGVLRLLTVGRLSVTKRLPLLIEAVERLVRQGCQVHLTVVGGGAQEPELRRLLGERNLHGAVTLMGRRAGDEMPQIYRQHDVFVSASMQEGMSNAMLEAMASGLPVVSTRCEGVEELVADNGIIVEAPDPATLAEAVRTLAENPPVREAMARAARTRASLFSWSRAAELYLEQYHRVLER